jgi:hypothetical protein
MLEPTAFKLEVLTESEKKKRQFFGQTIWALGAAAAALVLVVLLFKTRSDSIKSFRAANKELQGIEAKYKKIREWKLSTEAHELDQRQKEIALRIRRLPGAFTRAVLGTLRKSHGSRYIYLDKLDMEPQKRSFDLDGNPGDPQAQIGSSEEAKDNIHAQKIWPELTVEGQLLEDTPDVGTEFANYVGELKRNLAAVTAEGWKIELKSKSPDRNKRFSLTFEIQVAKPGEGS